jgi:hypothetical protein
MLSLQRGASATQEILGVILIAILHWQFRGAMEAYNLL